MAERTNWLGQDSTEQDVRLGIGALFAPGTGLAVVPGVLDGLAVTQTGAASVNVSVAVGRALNQATSSIGGAYLETLDAAKTIDVIGGGGLAPGGNPRNDLIVYESGLAVGSKVHRVEGTPAAIPVDPAVPSQAVPLARVRVKTAAAYGGSVTIVNADIDDLRTFTGMKNVRLSQRYGSDGGFPLATTATSSEVVVNRATVPAADYDRNILINAGLYTSYTQAFEYEALLYVNSTLLHRDRRTGPTPTSQSLTGGFTLAAGGARTVEVRIVRVGGTGVVSVSGTTFQRLEVLAVPA